MVKNTQGGNKSKGFARKNLAKKDFGLRVASEEGEVYAQAVRVLGGSIASAIDIDGNPLKAHIRGKFRGRGKRDNFIGPNTWMLVGLHTWEGDKVDKSAARNCDILEVYSDTDKLRLVNSVTSVDWKKFVANDSKTITSTSLDDDMGVTFAHDAAPEYEELIAAQAATKSKSGLMLDEDETEINIDDI
jgi:hypothetical protein